MLTLAVSCSNAKDNGGDAGGDSNNGTQNGSPSDDGEKPAGSGIVLPDYKDHGRGTEDFADLVYKRPDLESIFVLIKEASDTVEGNALPLGNQIEALRGVEDDIELVNSMYSLTEIYKNRDTSRDFWQKENAYITENLPRFTALVEDLLIACARSEHKSAFEERFFKYSLDGYLDGKAYTDEAVLLMEKEAELEIEYTSFSTANVTMTYTSIDGFSKTGTVDEIYEAAREKYGVNTDAYTKVFNAVTIAFNSKVRELQKPIFIELIKTRRLIADAMDIESYRELAYADNEYEYSSEEMDALLADIGNYLAPVYNELDDVIFSAYFNKTVQPDLSRVKLINKMYYALKLNSPELFDIYCYMLQHGLYDIEAKTENRFSGAFTTYIDSNSSPFIFMSTIGKVSDYSILAHEFGHFADGYFNNGNSGSLDVAEISSTALELLSIQILKDSLAPAEYEYYEYYTLYSSIYSGILMQAFYASFESLAYELEYDEITESSLNECIKSAYSTVFGDDRVIIPDLSNVMIIQTALYPFYVQSYVTAGISSFEIFLLESERTGNEGDGIKAYLSLIDRDGEELGYLSALEKAGLTSPFDEDTVKSISNKLYYHLIGKYYYKENCELPGVA